ncbi:tRNA methyltransferase ppm2 [Lambiella insularis]|nr:tRNA methyltransferase ppm2 [Lambiella insularis]
MSAETKEADDSEPDYITAQPHRQRKEKRIKKKHNVKAFQDASVIGTNDASTVSKRDVERHFYPPPHVYGHFVKKPKQRSPLIHRGYWLRMYAIESIVKKFLAESTEKRRVILNLGCG